MLLTSLLTAGDPTIGFRLAFYDLFLEGFHLQWKDEQAHAHVHIQIKGRRADGGVEQQTGPSNTRPTYVNQQPCRARGYGFFPRQPQQLWPTSDSSLAFFSFVACTSACMALICSINAATSTSVSVEPPPPSGRQPASSDE